MSALSLVNFVLVVCKVDIYIIHVRHKLHPVAKYDTYTLTKHTHTRIHIKGESSLLYMHTCYVERKIEFLSSDFACLIVLA